jgi:hypothetical protein
VKERDPLAIGLGALASGIGLGGAVVTLAQIGVAILRRVLHSDTYNAIAPDPLLVGLTAGLAVGAASGWLRGRPLDDFWQRGVIGVLAAVGSLLAGFLAAPIHRFVGLPGMFVWLGALLWFGVAAARWSQRGAGTAEPGGTP